MFSVIDKNRYKKGPLIPVEFPLALLPLGQALAHLLHGRGVKPDALENSIFGPILQHFTQFSDGGKMGQHLIEEFITPQ